MRLHRSVRLGWLLRVPLAYCTCRPRLAGFDGEACGEGVQGGIGLHLGGVDVEFAVPHQPRLLALRNNGLEELAEDFQPVAQADARQARMVGQRLVQIEPEKPPDTQPVGGEAHQMALRAQALEEHHQLQAKEDHRIDAWSPVPAA
jgi:hypothetical protein